MKTKKILSLVLAFAFAATLTACETDGTTESTANETSANTADAAAETTADETDSDEVTVVKVGVVGANNEQWDTINEILEADNIRVELVEFSEYKLPNEALNAGEIDMNAFQHKAYLNNEIEALGYDIAVLGDTIIAPLSLYSDKITDISELKDGDKIAVPSDPTNEGRCFKILESAGVLTVDPEAGYTPELKDITDNPLNLEFVEVEAANTASLLPDVAAAFVNGAHAVDNGLKLEDAVYTEKVESGSDNPYINVLVVRTEDLNNETYLKILAAYQSEKSAQAILDIYQGTYIPAFDY